MFQLYSVWQTGAAVLRRSAMRNGLIQAIAQIAGRRGSDQLRTSLHVAHLNLGGLPGPAARCQQFIEAVDLRMQEEDHTRWGRRGAGLMV